MSNLTCLNLNIADNKRLKEDFTETLTVQLLDKYFGPEEVDGQTYYPSSPSYEEFIKITKEDLNIISGSQFYKETGKSFPNELSNNRLLGLKREIGKINESNRKNGINYVYGLFNIRNIRPDVYTWGIRKFKGNLDTIAKLKRSEERDQADNKNRVETQNLRNELKKNDPNQTTLFQNTTEEERGIIASEKTIRDLAARMSARIGMPIKFESDRSKEYKGKIKNNVAYINLAYATLDTPIHEILGHPIIRAIKNRSQNQEDSSFNKLYENLLEELSTTQRGKEVLDRIKRDYTNKTNEYDYSKGEKISDEEYDNIKASEENTGSDEYLGRDFYEKRVSDKVYTIQKGEDANPNSARVYTLPTYSLEEQQEEAIVELLGLMTAEKLDNVKDGKLISLLKRLLKQIKAFVKDLIKQREVDIEKLPDNMTIGDIANLLAYSNNKLILPGYEVKYTTPDNVTFKTYTEASNHITELIKNIKEVDLSNISLNKKLSLEQEQKIKETEDILKSVETYFNSKEYQVEKQKTLQELNDQLEALKSKKPVFKSQESSLDLEDKKKYGFDDYDYVRIESSYSRIPFDGQETLWQRHFGKDFEGYYIHGYNTDKDKSPTKVLKITKEDAEKIWEKELNENSMLAYGLEDRQLLYQLNEKINDTERDLNIVFRISQLEKEINLIKDNPITDFITKNKQYEQSKEIIEEWKKINKIVYNPEEIYSRGQEFVSVVGAYSSFDVDLMMQNLLQHIEDNEKAGGEFTISAFTKPVDKTINHLEGIGGKIKFKIYPQPQDIKWAADSDVYSGSVWDASEKVSTAKESELLGVSYTKYPSLNNIDYIQPNLASIVDEIKHHHNELGISLTGNNFRLEYDDDIPYKTKKILDGINSILDQKYGKLVKTEISIPQRKILSHTSSTLEGKYVAYLKGGEEQTFNTKNELDNFIKSLKEIGVQPTQTKDNLKESIESVKNKTLDIIKTQRNLDREDLLNKGYEELDYGVFYRPKEYTEQALINTKIAKLKEVAKKYPRSLIRSEVVRTKERYSGEFSGFEEEELPFQKVSSPMLNIDQNIEPDNVLNKALLSKLQTAIPNVKLTTVSQEEASKMSLPEGTNAFYDRKGVTLIEGRINDTVLIEEFLHPVINTLATENPTLYKALLEEAKVSHFSTLKQVEEKYRAAYQGDIAKIEKEFLTHVIRNEYRKLWKNDTSSTLSKLWNRFVQFINKYFFKSKLQLAELEGINTIGDFTEKIYKTNKEIEIVEDIKNDLNESDKQYNIGTYDAILEAHLNSKYKNSLSDLLKLRNQIADLSKSMPNMLSGLDSEKAYAKEYIEKLDLVDENDFSEGTIKDSTLTVIDSLVHYGVLSRTLEKTFNSLDNNKEAKSSDFYKINRAVVRIKGFLNTFLNLNSDRLYTDLKDSPVIIEAKKSLAILEKLSNDYNTIVKPRIAQNLAFISKEINSEFVNNINEEIKGLKEKLLKADPSVKASIELNIEELEKLIKEKQISVDNLLTELAGDENSTTWWELNVFSTLNTQNPLVHSLFTYIKTAINEGVKDARVHQLALEKIANKYIENTPDFNKRNVKDVFEKFHREVDVTYIDYKTGELKTYKQVVYNTKTLHQEFLNDLMEFDKKIKDARKAVNEGADKKVLDDAFSAKHAFVEKYAEKEKTPEYYDLVGTLPQFVKDAQKALWDDKSKYIAKLGTSDGLTDVEFHELIDLNYRIKLLGSRYNAQGYLKSGEELDIAEELIKYRNLKKQEDVYEPFSVSDSSKATWQIKKDIIDKSNDLLEKDKWYKINTYTKIVDKFYKDRQVHIDEIGRVLSKVKDESSELKKIDINKAWQEIFNATAPYRENDGVLNGLLMDEVLTAKVNEFELEIEELKKQITKLNGLTYEENEKLKELVYKLKSHQYSSEELAQLESERDAYLEKIDYQKKNGLSEKDVADLQKAMKAIDNMQVSTETEWYKTKYKAKLDEFNPSEEDLQNANVTDSKAPEIYNPADYPNKKISIRNSAYNHEIGEKSVRKLGDKYYEFEYVGELTYVEASKYSLETTGDNLEKAVNSQSEMLSDFPSTINGKPKTQHVFNVKEKTDINISTQAKEALFRESKWFLENHIPVTKYVKQDDGKWIIQNIMRPNFCWRVIKPRDEVNYPTETVPSELWGTSKVKEKYINPNYRAVDGNLTPRTDNLTDDKYINKDYRDKFKDADREFMDEFFEMYKKQQELISFSQRPGFRVIGREADRTESINQIGINTWRHLQKGFSRIKSGIKQDQNEEFVGVDTTKEDLNQEGRLIEKNYLKMLYVQNVKLERISYNMLDNMSLFIDEANKFNKLYETLPDVLGTKNIVGDTSRTAQAINDLINANIYGRQVIATTNTGRNLQKIARKLKGLTAWQQLSLNLLGDTKNLVVATLFSNVFASDKYFTKSQVLGNMRKMSTILIGGQGIYKSSLKGGEKSEIIEIMKYWNALQGHGNSGMSTGYMNTIERGILNFDFMMKGREFTEFLAQASITVSLLENMMINTEEGNRITANQAYEFKEGVYKLKEGIKVSIGEEARIRGVLERLNQKINGNHSKINQTGYQRYWWGQLLSFYKNHLVSGFKDRFVNQKVDYNLGETNNAIYEQMIKYLLVEVIKKRNSVEKSTMSDLDKIKAWQGIKEMVVMAGLIGLRMLLEWYLKGEDDEKWDDKIAWNFLNLVNQTNQEILQFNPVDFLMDNKKTIPILYSTQDNKMGVKLLFERTKNQALASFATTNQILDIVSMTTRKYVLNDPETYKRSFGNIHKGDDKLNRSLQIFLPGPKSFYKLWYPKDAVAASIYYKGK